MESKFKAGDVINYGVFSNVKVVEVTEKEYILQDSVGNTLKVYRRLVDKYGAFVIKK